MSRRTATSARALWPRRLVMSRWPRNNPPLVRSRTVYLLFGHAPSQLQINPATHRRSLLQYAARISRHTHDGAMLSHSHLTSPDWRLRPCSPFLSRRTLRATHTRLASWDESEPAGCDPTALAAIGVLTGLSLPSFRLHTQKAVHQLDTPDCSHQQQQKQGSERHGAELQRCERREREEIPQGRRQEDDGE
jgi:hypothetical protein